jgi:serine/threonine protein phosphatase PrpC
MIPSIRFTTNAVTHPGCSRQINEDSQLVREEDAVWAVADGMGGHLAGEVASAAIVEALGDASIGGDLDARVDRLEAILGAANRSIYEAGVRAGARMGSTAVVLHIFEGKVVVLWAGDSRIYRLRDGVLSRMTRDHTTVQDMVDRGLLTPQEAIHHPLGHVISRAVGVEPDLDVEVRIEEVHARDVFLLCSDGLTGVISDDEITEHLVTSRRGACQALLDLTLERGAPDNVTIVTVACEEKTALIFEQET